MPSIYHDPKICKLRSILGAIFDEYAEESLEQDTPMSMEDFAVYLSLNPKLEPRR